MHVETFDGYVIVDDDGVPFHVWLFTLDMATVETMRGRTPYTGTFWATWVAEYDALWFKERTTHDSRHIVSTLVVDGEQRRKMPDWLDHCTPPRIEDGWLIRPSGDEVEPLTVFADPLVDVGEFTRLLREVARIVQLYDTLVVTMYPEEPEDCLIDNPPRMEMAGWALQEG